MTGQLSKEVELIIKGMSCASCVKRVEDRLINLTGVEDARVNLATEKVNIKYDPNKS